ncbi:MAG TPA: chitobiase/beta-hexosaminidase C-terminal domain-containing protein, partial [Opitutus sp.]|nr:chitobiase/beta-hexosaminidase C-terminal domain-containing protein [Opitutus sp.]
SGGAYAHAITTGSDNITMDFTPPASEDYYVHARVRMDGPSAQQPNQNSVWLLFGSEQDEWDFASIGTDWSWDTARVPRATTTDVTGPISFAAGPAHIEIGKRESGVQIDTIVVSNSPFPPRVAAPAFSPAGGTYSGSQSVTISSATTGAAIRYTTDGSTPTRTHGTVYSGAVNIAATSVLKAIAYKDQLQRSPVTADAYAIGSGGGGGAGAFQMSGNEVVMEAEHFTTETSGDGHDWTLTTLSGASGDASDNAIQATPNNGTGYATLNSAATRVDYAFDVPSGSAGNFYVHLRHLGPTTSDDSVYLSIDGNTSSAVQMNFYTTLSWRATVSTFAIPAGSHTLTIWMREDGAIVDKIVINDSATDPTGTGPAESAQASGDLAFQPDANGDFVMEAEHYSAKTDSTDNWTPITDASASGGGSDNALQSLPNDGTAYASLDTSASHVDYRINVPAAAGYYVHLRDYGATSTDDSVYVSIDGGTTAQTITAGRSLDWKSSPGTLAIPAGEHMLTVWDREDGCEVDKIVVSTSSTPPTGSGPPESDQN